MKFRRFCSAFLAAVVVLPGLATAGPLKIDRSIRREPAYGAKPHYCLLLFGPEAKMRVWLVVAGEAFYADRNGNGDLAEPGKRVYSVGNQRVFTFFDPYADTMWLPVPENERIYQVGDIFDTTVRTWYNVTVRRSGKLKTATFEIVVDIRGRFRQLGQLARFGDSPQDAPVLHFNGPLTLGLGTSQLARGASGTEVSAWIGTHPPAVEKGAPAYVIHDGAIPSYVSVAAWFEFAGRATADRPIRRSLILGRREGLILFSNWTKVPQEAGTGTASITLSLPNWKWGRVRPATLQVPVVEPKKLSAPLIPTE